MTGSKCDTGIRGEIARNDGEGSAMSTPVAIVMAAVILAASMLIALRWEAFAIPGFSGGAFDAEGWGVEIRSRRFNFDI